ncbi:ABC transporter permease subunit [Deinococcus sp. AJ005]|uniref:ABC transporter permease subunit n=1 Tax=Deinococcus sp. AJ005 TaxID=2652443 RepID=UPI0018657ED0|nr:ABC transporter permease subunit [Deinococcus sp. AJ005]
MRTDRRGGHLGVLASFLLLHAALLLGMQRQIPLPQRMAEYPAQLLGIFRPDVLATVLPLALLSGTYLLGGLLLAWVLAALLGRFARPVLWVLEGLPPFLLLVAGVGAGLAVTLPRGWDFPLTAWSPLMLTLIVASLALPAATRAALATQHATGEALAADHSRVARAMGLSERAVLRRAARVALPGRAAGLAGDVLGLALSLAVIEGLLQFPGVGNEVYVALQGTFAGADGQPFQAQTLSASLAALLGLALLFAAVGRALAAHLDPRPRAGADKETGG